MDVMSAGRLLLPGILALSVLAGCDEDGSNVTVSGIATVAGTQPLNDTGIDWCADAVSNFVGCLAARILPGQDARYGRDAKAAAGTLTNRRWQRRF